ncbi:DUF1570 domain-containing protein [Rohdeia mirabilis]
MRSTSRTTALAAQPLDAPSFDGLFARLLALLATAAAVLALAPQASAQGGYRGTKLENIGVELPVPRHYEPIPVDPLEEWVVHKWVLQQSKMREPEKDEWGNEYPKPYRPTLEMVWIDNVPDAGPITGGEGTPPPVPGARKEPRPQSEPTNSLERYLAREPVGGRLMGERFVIYPGTFELGPAQEQKDIDDENTATMYELHPGPNGQDLGNIRAWAYEVKSAKRTIAFIGYCEEPEWKDHTKIWEHMASKVEFFAPDGKDAEKLRKAYARRPQYVDPEFRIKIIQNLVRGWDYKDTENYIFIFRDNLEKSPLLRRLMTDIEAIRELYIELFPPSGPITAVSTVRICKDEDEYMQYGGPPGSGGYWNPGAEELVFYDYPDKEGEKKGTGTENTLIVLYHEAFHQYIYYSTGEVAPHSWYNEGTGDYFSGALISGGKYKKMQVNTWRIEYIQQMIRDKRFIPWQEITKFSQGEYYRQDRVGLCYAQGWSMIYFLRECKEARDHEVWSKILDIYFNVMKDEYNKGLAEALEGLAEGAELDPTAKYMIGLAARDVAVEKAFEGVDWFEIEEAWKEFTLSLKVPK